MAYYIKIGSITNAQRGRSLLRANSMNVQIRRLENPGPGEGCGYVLALEGDADKAMHLLQKNGLRVLGVERL